MKGMEIKRVIQYSDLYPEQADNLPDAQEFIKRLRREDLCTLTANMVSMHSGMQFYDFNFNPRKNEFDFVRFFLSDRDLVFTQDVINRHSAPVKRLPESYKGIFIATGKAAIMIGLKK